MKMSNSYIKDLVYKNALIQIINVRVLQGFSPRRLKIIVVYCTSADQPTHIPVGSRFWAEGKGLHGTWMARLIGSAQKKTMIRSLSH